MSKKKKEPTPAEPKSIGKTAKTIRRLTELSTLGSSEFETMLREETDRACAVLGAAYLDGCLERVLRQNLANREDIHERLFDMNGPLSTFSGKILVFRALDWIDKDTFDDLDSLRSIRNAFAHNFDHSLSFTENAISAKCLRLIGPNAYLKAIETRDPHVYEIVVAQVTSRWRFQLAVSSVGKMVLRWPSPEAGPLEYAKICEMAVTACYEDPLPAPSPPPPPPAA